MQLQRSRPLKRSFSKLPIILIVLTLMGGGLGFAYLSKNPNIQSTPQTNTVEPVVEEQDLNIEEKSATIDTDTLFNNYSSTYDDSTSEYSFDYNDLNTYFNTAGSGSLKYGTSIYSSGSESWTINCSQYTNSCTAYSSNGRSASSYCYQYSNSCSTYGSDGSYSNTYCYEYSNSCSSYDSDGSYSNTYCYEYSNSCSTYDSSGGYSNSYCYEYSNSCSTYNSDGSTTNTYCYEYSNSCNSYSSGGYSDSYDYSW